MRQETISALPIIVSPLMLLFIYTVLAYLSERSNKKEIEKRKYKRNVLMNASSLTKSGLEIKELTAR